MRDYLPFIVLRRKNQWALKSADQERHFPGQLKAIEAAITLANDYGKNGKPSVVLLQRTKSQFDSIWTYGRDSYPPKLSKLRRIVSDNSSPVAAEAQRSAPAG
jgi:hypothetical protein